MEITQPVKMFIDTNVLEKNKDLIYALGKKCLVVTGKNSAIKSGVLDDIDSIFEGKVAYRLFDEISPNPLVESVLKAGKVAKEYGADFIVGIGGGSVLDSAKVIAALANNPSESEEELYAQKWENPALPLVLIGTTAGTGSEVTKVAVLTKKNGRKSSMHHNAFYATYAFGDPKYTASMNKDVTVSTGIDALTHALESYFNNKATDDSRNYAVKALGYLLPELAKLKDDNYTLTNKERENMYVGSIVAGQAIDITGTTFAHNVGYYFTETYHLAHGYACAIFARDLVKFELKQNPDYAAKFFTEIKMNSVDFVELIDSLLPKLDIKISKETLDEIIPRWDNNNSVKNTYGTMGKDDVYAILAEKFG